jgi:CHAT domain-containing protein
MEREAAEAGGSVRSAATLDEEVGALAALPRLPGSRQEVALLSDLVPESTVLLGADASEQELVRLADSGALAAFGTIHLATHALVDDELPERSALVLSQVDLPDPLDAAISGERIYDGLLTAKEIVREWTMNADLVTLSACETALGKEIVGEGYIGFAHAFLQAGTRSLLVSLWKVEDRATSLLMRRFYENRAGAYEDEREGLTGRPMTKAAALREAKRWLRGYTDEEGRQPYGHPYYWSAFILIGERGEMR